MATKTTSEPQNVAEEIRKLPDLSASQVAQKVDCAVNYVYHVRAMDKKLAKKLSAKSKRQVKATPKTPKEPAAERAPVKGRGRGRGKKKRTKGTDLTVRDLPEVVTVTKPAPEAQVVPSIERAFVALLVEVGLKRARELVKLTESKTKAWAESP